jgi:hypothetical protein
LLEKGFLFCLLLSKRLRKMEDVSEVVDGGGGVRWRRRCPRM